MSILKIGKCAVCGKLVEILPTNNPITGGACLDCIIQQINPRNMEQANFFCRTWNIPFNPDKWIELVERLGANKMVFAAYVEMWSDSNPTTPVMWAQGRTRDLWKEINDEWERCNTFAELLAAIEPVKEQFMRRARIKWGGDYSFEEYMQLDSLLVSTLQAGDITNPLQIDAIKKAARISIQLDQAILKGDAKAIKDLTSAYSTFTKTAQIDEVIAATNKDVISTVSDLGDFIEQCGGQFEYYDNVPRDVVDKTINDIKEYIRVLVEDCTGLSSTLEGIARSYAQKVEEGAHEDAIAELSLEDLMKDNMLGANNALDAELASEDIDLSDFLEDPAAVGVDAAEDEFGDYF
jgi:hypothetical protein